MVITYGHPARGTQDSFLARTQEFLDVAWHLLSAERTAVFRPYPIRLTDAGWHLHDEGNDPLLFFSLDTLPHRFAVHVMRAQLRKARDRNM
jgi:hypothetical protein